MKNYVTTELSFNAVCLWYAHLKREPVRPIIGSRTEATVTRVYMTNERGMAQLKNKEWKQKADES